MKTENSSTVIIWQTAEIKNINKTQEDPISSKVQQNKYNTIKNSGAILVPGTLQ